MTLHAIVALAVFSGAVFAAATAIRVTVLPRIDKIQAALRGQGGL